MLFSIYKEVNVDSQFISDSSLEWYQNFEFNYRGIKYDINKLEELEPAVAIKWPLTKKVNKIKVFGYFGVEYIASQVKIFVDQHF